MALFILSPCHLVKHEITMPLNGLYIIGLTCNIACGKSTVLGLLRERGAQALDADRVTHELQAPGQPVYEAIVAEFGPSILSAPAGPIDRRALGAIVFADSAVRERIMAWLADLGVGSWELGVGENQPPTPNSQLPVAVIDAIKLLEG